MAGNIPKEKPPYVKVLNCPNCASPVVIRGGDNSISVVCESCHTVLVTNDPKYKILQVFQQKRIVDPNIPLGQRGKLKGIEWEVIGYMQREDVYSGYIWEEYLLFNPYLGYSWLTQSEGHWNFVIMLKQKPQSSVSAMRSFSFLGNKYSLFHRGRAKVNYVLGEFYWRVKVGEETEVADFICPPYMLSYEGNSLQNEFTWSQGEYLDRQEINKNFEVNYKIPYPSGVGPNQLSPVGGQFMPTLMLWVIFCAVLVLLQFVHVGFSKNISASLQGYTYEKYYSTPQSYVTPSFELEGGVGNVDISANGSLDNNWLSLDIDLVNDKTGDVSSFSKTLESYSGYEGGEYWREGEPSKSTLLSSVPAGTYHLDIEAAGEKPSSFVVSVKRGVVNVGNFMWALIFLSIWPGVIFLRNYFFETSRWAGSDYAPALYSQGEE